MRPLPAPRMRSDQWVFNRRPSFTLGEFNGTVFFSAVVADLHLSQSIRLAPIPLGSPVRAAGRLCGWRETQRVPMTGLQRIGAGSSTRLFPLCLRHETTIMNYNPERAANSTRRGGALGPDGASWWRRGCPADVTHG